MRIGVIGGSGFIGSHTIPSLQENNHDVVVIDIEQPYNKGVRYIRADITKYEEALRAVSSLDAVYMLAACKYVNVCFNDPVYAVDTNIQGLTNVLQACRCANVGRVIFASSVWVYNGCIQSTVNEETDIVSDHTRSLYGYTKVVGESLVKNFHHSYGLDYTILRYGVAYGPRSSDETVISKFINRAINDEPLVICGTGDVCRSFLYVTDHASANLLALSDSAKNQTFNIEGTEQITVNKVANTVKKLTGKAITIQHTEPRTGEFNGVDICINKAKNVLGWSPEISFDEGMKLHYEWMTRER